jgi:hypothetical protein
VNQRPSDLPLIGAIAGAIRWCEELISLLSGPLLSIGLAIALIDLLTGGGLLRAAPDLLFAWGICQAVGIDAQLVAAWDRCRMAMRAGKWAQVIALAILGVALGYVGFLSAEAFGFQQAFGLTESDALAQLGIDAASWQLQRALLAVYLVALSGFTRYHPQHKTVADEQAALERELELEPLRQQVRATKAIGVAALARQTLAAVRGAPSDSPPPTNGGKPLAATSDAPESAESTPEPPATRRSNTAATGRCERAFQRSPAATGSNPVEPDGFSRVEGAGGVPRRHVDPRTSDGGWCVQQCGFEVAQGDPG